MVGVEAFRNHFESGDADALVAHLAPQFAFYHPLDAHPTTDPGRARAFIAAARELMHDFRFIDELRGTAHAALLWNARIGEHDAEGVDVLKVDGHGRLVEIRIIIRPVAAIRAWSEGMRERFGGGGPHGADVRD